MSNRFRFAPSPTGLLHVGGARTALYNYLLARSSGGKFILRIEDTDRQRSTGEAVDQILEGLEWLGLEWDEGPFSQFERVERHREVIDKLLDAGSAYRSSATTENVHEAREANDGLGFRGEPDDVEGAAVRLRVPDEGETVVRDLIRGETGFENRLLDDFVIARSDGTPLYNFAVAIDDLDMGITTVVRGEDHLSNTPRQLLILEALDAEMPTYAHLPLLMGADGKKLSKRHGAASIKDLMNAGFVPGAVVNYLALLGWGYDDKTTFFSLDDLVDKFSLEKVSSSSAVFDEKKLRWMNGHYLREMGSEELARNVGDYLQSSGIEEPGELFQEATNLVQEKISTLDEFWPMVVFLFREPQIDERSYKKVFGGGKGLDELKRAREALSDVDPFDLDGIEKALRDLVDKMEMKPNKVFQPIRVAISGKTVSPGIFESLELLGKQTTLSRIDEAVARLEKGEQP